jgi:hypothetical protein
MQTPSGGKNVITGADTGSRKPMMLDKDALTLMASFSAVIPEGEQKGVCWSLGLLHGVMNLLTQLVTRGNKIWSHSL